MGKPEGELVIKSDMEAIISQHNLKKKSKDKERTWKEEGGENTKD